MSAGSFGAGVGPAGLDPVALPSARLVLPPPAPILFQLGTRGFVQNDDGTLQTVANEVDQAVELALGIGVGTIASMPALGNTFRQITRIDPTKRQATAESVVRNALANLIAKKYVLVTAVTLQPPDGLGRFPVAVTYFNAFRVANVPTTITAIF